MQIQISTRHGSVSDATQEKIKSKVERLKRYFERLTTIEVTADMEHRDAPSVDVRSRPSTSTISWPRPRRESSGGGRNGGGEDGAATAEVQRACSRPPSQFRGQGGRSAARRRNRCRSGNGKRLNLGIELPIPGNPAQRLAAGRKVAPRPIVGRESGPTAAAGQSSGTRAGIRSAAAAGRSALPPDV